MDNCIESFRKLIVQIDSLKAFEYDNPENEVWRGKVLRQVKRCFGNDSDYLNEIKDVLNPGIVVTENTPDSYWTELHLNTLNSARVHLQAYLEDLEQDSEDNKNEVNVPSITLNFKEIFIVHGRDDTSKLELARTLENDFNLKAIILHEQPNQGRTVIEKLERYATGPGYAIVILTPDDIGAEIKSNGTQDNLSPRARQNVILELGYFIGKLGRERVCVLHKGKVELPSDISGVLFLPFNQSVKETYTDLLKELKHAGYSFHS